MALDRSLEKSVRQLNYKERSYVIEASATKEFWRELWQRSKLWRRIIGAGFAGAVAYVQFASDFWSAVGHLSSILGLK